MLQKETISLRTLCGCSRTVTVKSDDIKAGFLYIPLKARDLVRVFEDAKAETKQGVRIFKEAVTEVEKKLEA